MKVLVSDSSVLIDLLRYRLIGLLARLPHEFIVSDITLAVELIRDDDQTTDLLEAILRVESLTSDEMSLLEDFGMRFPPLSVPDCAALALVESRGLPLLAGDALMREVARGLGHEVRGTLWIIDEYLQRNIVAADVILKVLRRMYKDPRIRLPHSEIGKRIKKLEDQQ